MRLLAIVLLVVGYWSFVVGVIDVGVFVVCVVVLVILSGLFIDIVC